MISSEVRRMADILQDELKKVKRSISKSALFEEAWMITFVIQGLRCAGLLSKLHTDYETITALKKALNRILNGQMENILILVHVPSQQTFVANRKILTRRLEQVGIDKGNAYLAIDSDDLNADVQTNAPQSLTHTLGEIKRESDRLKIVNGQGRMNVQVICLICQYPHSGLADAKTGVALAGWILEYPLIYHFSSSRDIQLQAISALDYDIEEILSNSSDWWEGADDMQTNNLAGKDMVAFSVNLQISSQSKEIRNILQFTIPLSAIETSAKVISLCDHGIDNIKQYLVKYFGDRIQGQKSEEFSISVTTNQVRTDRVAI